MLRILLEVGYEPLFIYEKVEEGFSFELCVFSAPTADRWSESSRNLTKLSRSSSEVLLGGTSTGSTGEAKPQPNRLRKTTSDNIDSTRLTLQTTPSLQPLIRMRSWDVGGKPVRADWDGVRALVGACWPEVCIQDFHL